MREARHGWIIDCDHVYEEGFNLTDQFGTIGPRNISQKVQNRLRLLRGNQIAHRWRAKDSDGNIYYEGRYVGPDDERMFSPLEDFAMPDAGATTIEYLNTDTGVWEEL